MASDISYKITLSNNKTEKQAIDFLQSVDKRFLLPSKEGRKQIVEALQMEKRFSRTFDLFILPRHTNNEREITIANAKDITLVELKTTQKYLPENPKGFFFGATQNEFDMAKKLGKQYKFCFVSLHPESLGYKLVSLEELQKLIKTQRTQYQINLKK
ncbi:hypothetical protein KC722_00205 [Candidatus Kaiserbacteria bacterium]|nr:hypothetical protein [Candidatus Kaiserbacteria bacterium]MCB9811321.1 hypothetical protein [Candidatus Nomurabacteria bacterium]